MSAPLSSMTETLRALTPVDADNTVQGQKTAASSPGRNPGGTKPKSSPGSSQGASWHWKGKEMAEYREFYVLTCALTC